MISKLPSFKSPVKQKNDRHLRIPYLLSSFWCIISDIFKINLTSGFATFPKGLTMICPKCQTENPETKKFCRKCGAKFLRVCPQCNSECLPADEFCGECGQPLISTQPPIPTGPEPEGSIPPSTPHPVFFASDRYQIKEFIGEGGKKKVYRAYDTLLDRDVALALIKTEGMDKESMARITREAQAMGRLGAHPNIVTVFDLGRDQDQPYIVTELMGGGDVEGLLAKAEDHRLDMDQVMEIAESVCKGLEYAHGKGVIHRDLKPGNVWITEEGMVKIGDFGLALVEDRTRLTGQGLMLGTVSYMAPEQATGGQVTVQTDLYALGAMFYEMVTGRPPFIGDDPVAIIGQHINTPPVSPSWHNPDIPPHLEALILRCLEKDPLSRPKSITEVKQALTSKGASIPETPLPDHKSPLYRRVFVGREKEIKTLQIAFDRALSGEGSVVMVVGEPGIGKTALCEQTATYVGLRGGLVLIGHCYEKGSLSLPYLPFIEALRSYVLNKGDEELRHELGSGATYVGRIISEVKERFAIELPPPGDPEEDRYRLFESVTGFLKNASTVKPILLILEDLHDADKGTLDLLNHMARHLSGFRLLIIGNYRDVEVDRTHPLSAALAELMRGSLVGRILLRGLTADELQRMLSQITGSEVPYSLSEAIYRQTEGNPLFVQEVVRYLVEEGLLTKDKKGWQTESRVLMSIPEGLRDVIGKRLSSLSQECNRVLSVASVIGRDFQLEVLQVVAGISEEDLYKVIEEAQNAALIEERPQSGRMIRYRFTHAFFRQTLYEEIIAPRRIRLHQQVARALEEVYKTRLEEHAAELAEHFSYSSDSADLAKAVSYGEMGAKRAMSVYAYGEAVRLLEQALKVQEILDPEDMAKRCDLLLDLCEALLWTVELKRILDLEAPAAFALAEVLEDNSRASRACQVALNAIIFEESEPGFATHQAAEWAKRADRYAKPDTIERAFADATLGATRIAIGHLRSGIKLLNQALDLTRKLNDLNVLFWVGVTLLLFQRGPQHAQKNVMIVKEIMSNKHFGVNALVVGRALELAGDAFLVVGNRPAAEEIWEELRAITKRTDQIGLWIISTAVDGLIALIDGRLEDTVDLAQNISSRGEETGTTLFANGQAGLSGIRAQVYLGRSLEALDHEYRLAIRIGNIALITSLLCLIQAHLGRTDEVSKILEQWVVKRPGIGQANDETSTFMDANYLEAAILTGHQRASELLLNRFTGTDVVTSGIFYPTCIPRHMGGAAALLGRYEEARNHYHEAIRICTDMRFRPELALSRLQLAELLLEHYPEERTDAIAHLDFAIAEFRDMKMQPSLECALRHKEILEA
jgi:tetratricopeptide (TPR) repeat protein/ribosomal protein L40E